MDDVTKKVLEETWELGGSVHFKDSSRKIHVVCFSDSDAADVHNHTYLTNRFVQAAEEKLGPRVRLAACAPEMARLLLEGEMASGGNCPWCLARVQPHTEIPVPNVDYAIAAEHAPGCRWLAVVKKAGLR